MELEKAQIIASIWKEKLKPYCERIEVAGSIRRERPHVNDIEIICIPQEIDINSLFEGMYKARHPEFINALRDTDTVRLEIGKPYNGKYVRLYLIEHQIKVDVFICNKINWGHMLAIRTGSSDFSHWKLASGWVRKGYHSEGGMLMDSDGNVIPVPEEEDLFKLIGLDYVPPQQREI